MTRRSYENRVAAFRAEHPGLAALGDELRAAFPGVKLLGGIEDGREVGKVDDSLRRAEVYRRRTERLR